METRLSEPVAAPAERALQDLDRLLELAEELLEKYDTYAAELGRRWRLVIMAVVACLAMSLFALGVSPMLEGPGAWAAWGALGYVILTAAAIAPMWWRRIESLKRRMAQEERALREVVQLLRETEPAVSEERGWSAFDVAQFRIRLSRFPI